MKTYRRFIRVGGELYPSPRFTKKSDAEEWYHQMRRKKQFMRDGTVVDDENGGPKFIDWASTWIKRRMRDYGPATWKPDEQRLRDYILPLMSEVPLASITGAQVRGLLVKISEAGFLDPEKPDFKISTSTRTRVKALLSVIFSDALNEDPPLVKFNPVLGIKIKEKRKGQKKPRVLANTEECLKFIKKAKELGPFHFTVASTFLMSGLRKQELIALRWASVSFASKELRITEKYVQASNSIERGTKGGEEVTRVVPIPASLVAVLKEYRGLVECDKDDDFVFSKGSGNFYGPREIWAVIKEIATAAKVDTHPHALRHTFGREFAVNTGNLKALQAILGHASSATTDIYSDLAGSRIKGFGEAVSFSLDVNGGGK